MSKDPNNFEKEMNRRLARYREATFYDWIEKNECNFDYLKFPKIYCASWCIDTGRSILLIENIEGAKNLFEVFGSWKVKMRPDLERPIKLGNDSVTAIEMVRHVA